MANYQSEFTGERIDQILKMARNPGNGYFVTTTSGSSVGGLTQPVYVNGSGIVQPISYTINSTINSGTANRLAYYSGTNAISPLTNIQSDNSYFTILVNETVEKNSPHIYLKNTAWTKDGTAPSAANYSALEFNTSASAHNRLALVEATIETSGSSRLNLYLVPNAIDSDAWSGIVLQKTTANVLTISLQGSTIISGALQVNNTSLLQGNVTINPGKLEIYPNAGDYQEGIRIHAYSSWSDITLLGTDTTATSGTSANSWFIGNNNGNFYITRNGSSNSGTDATRAEFKNVGRIWKLRSYVAGGKANTWRSSLHIYGPTYGNTAADMVSGTAGVFRWNDGGPQITFDTNENPGGGQAGALIFTDHDTAATGVSFHFVTNQNSNNYGGDCTVTAPKFRARQRLTVGQNSDNGSYTLYVNGTGYFTNTVSLANNLLFNDANIQIRRNGRGMSWIQGRNGALLRIMTISGYSPAISIKTASGSWEIGAYNESSYQNQLIFTYCSDANFNNNTNSFDGQVRFIAGGSGNIHIGGNYIEMFGTNPYIDFHFGRSGADYTSRIIENVSGQLYIPGKLKVGTGRNGYALNAASFICDSWVRTVGSTGWFNESYGGGWYMTDSTWIRSYGSKSVYVNTGELRCDGATWGGRCRMQGDYFAVYGAVGNTGTRQGFIQIGNGSSRMYFRKENGYSSYAFDFNAPIYNSSTYTAAGGIQTTGGTGASIIAGIYKNTTAERQVQVNSGAGRLYMYCHAAANGGRGLYGTNNAGSSAGYLSINQSNAATHTTNSDKRIKIDRGLLSNDETFTVLKETEIVKFNYIYDTEQEERDNVEHIGVYAQDLRDMLLSHNYKNRNLLSMTIKQDIQIENPEDIIPTPEMTQDLATPEEDVDLYQMNYTAFISYLIKGWQIHNDEIEQLKQENDLLKQIIKEKLGVEI